MKDSFYELPNSIYCYKNSNVLINKLNIKDAIELEKYERKITLLKLYELRQNNLLGNFDIYHFIGIHRFLFEDIYPFAGLFRNENISKGNFRFAEFKFIESELVKILYQLKSDSFLLGLDKNEFSKKLSYYMSELNVLHPFREGNGRTIREFIRQLAYNNGYLLNFKYVKSKDILNACIKSVIDVKDLEDILYKCLEKYN